MEDHKTKSLQFLKAMVMQYCRPDAITFNNYVLEDHRFSICPGSADKHHAMQGGLVIHTTEVMFGVVSAIKGCKIFDKKQLHAEALVTATIWHDFGKIWDYKSNPNYGPGEVDEVLKRDQPWIKTNHRDKIRHVARSYAEFLKRAESHKWAPGFDMATWVEEVGHCILAHHGRLEWGSPVEPQTPEAWALHLADMTSVRVFDRAIRT